MPKEIQEEVIEGELTKADVKRELKGAHCKAEAKGWSQDKVAEVVGIDRTTVSKSEKKYK